MARLVEAESLQGAGEQTQGFVVGIRVPFAGRDQMRLGAEELDQLGQIGRRQIDHHKVSLYLFRNVSHRRRDDDELLAVETEMVEVAQTAANGRRSMEGLVKILE